MKKRVKRKKTLKLKRPSKTKKRVARIRDKIRIITEILTLKNLSIKVKEESTAEQKSDDDSLDWKLDDESEEELEEEFVDNSYGRRGTTNSSIYSGSPSSPYTDYDEIWGFLGEFRTKGIYKFSESEEKRLRETPLVIPSTEGILCDFEIIEDCVKHQKYFTAGDNMNGTYGMLPFGKVNSKDWEKFKMWAMVEYVLYKLYMDRM